jgi:hypothetical protein
MAGHDVARCNLGTMEHKSGKMERAVKNWMIAASAGNFYAMMLNLQKVFEKGHVSTDEFHSTLTAYNNSCVDMRSEARDAFIKRCIDHNPW